MSDSSVLRPGIALGPYPQREDLRDGWLDRTAASLGGFIRQRAYGRRPGRGAFLAQVHAEGEPLGALTDRQIRETIPELRRRLYSEGLQEPLVARTCAVVREICTRRLGMRPFDVQVLGARVMLEKVAGIQGDSECGRRDSTSSVLWQSRDLRFVEIGALLVEIDVV